MLLTEYHSICSLVCLLSLQERKVGDADRQRWTSWIGSGLGFLTTVALTGALGISRTQWVWLTMRKKWLTLDSIDSLFGITADPTLFLKWNMIRQAKVATVIAFAMWAFPLAAIITQGTISVQTMTQNNTIPCTVPSVLFGFDSSSTATIATWEKNVKIAKFWSWDKNYTGSTTDRYFIPALRLTAYTGTITRLSNLDNSTAFRRQCDQSCSYSVHFLGPAMTCTRVTAWNKTSWAKLDDFLRKNLLVTVPTTGRSSFLIGLAGNNSTGNPRIVFECKTTTGNYTVLHGVREGEYLEPVITKFEKVNLPGFEADLVSPNQAYWPTWGLFDQ